MMSKFLRFSLFISFIIVLFSCETDFNPNAPYQDITVVYGLLNQNDSITYIKINKAFLGSANAYEMAQNPDSSSYGGNLDVVMEEWINNSFTKVFYFDTTTVYNKEPGIFYAPKQVLYKCITAHQLSTGAEYRLIIKNKKTGKVINSKAYLVDNFYINTPDGNAPYIDFSKSGKKQVKWTSAKNGRRYQLKIKFNYSETDVLNNTVYKSIDWVFPDKKSSDLLGGIEMSSDYSGSQFYQILKSNIPVDHNLTRKAGKVEIIITVVADEFSTYLDVNAPSTSIVQIRPEYTNISNGIGIFSARYDNHINSPRRLDLNAPSYDSLKYGQYTKELGF